MTHDYGDLVEDDFDPELDWDYDDLYALLTDEDLAEMTEAERESYERWAKVNTVIRKRYREAARKKTRADEPVFMNRAERRKAAKASRKYR